MRTIDLRAKAKINLSLDVLGRRADGYHELRMVMQTIDLFDELELRATDTPGISLILAPATAREKIPAGRDNLACRAAQILMEEFSIREGVVITLRKEIPVSAGLAGGSTDAASVLSGVNELFHLGLSSEELMRRGAQIGADVPYCLLGGTALAEGIGERLTPLPPAPETSVLLVKPPVSVSTGSVYTRLDTVDVPEHPDTDAMICAIRDGSLPEIARNMGNVLEYVTAADVPMILDLIEQMKASGAAGASMSGSGPTVFGLFEDPGKAEQACACFQGDERLERVILTKFA